MMEVAMSSGSMNDNPRRRALIAGAACVASMLAARSGLAADELKPTRACDDHDATPRQMEGPFFKPRSPERTSLIESGVAGTRILVTGQVLSTRCNPVPGALLDFWQCDSKGEYDNRGNTLRGHQFTDAEGRYRLETILPGVYPGRTRHIHVKVQAPNKPILTTQLYFPNEPQNANDFLFRPDLLIAIGDAQSAGRFDFVLKLG
jgi:protocatechuate 3,4-dioxygenase beta subunit